MTEAERFWSRVDRSKGYDGCWPYVPSVERKRKRPITYAQYGGHPAHRYALIASGVEIIPGTVVDHRCYNVRCCNPRHLEQVTRAENSSRGATRAGILRRAIAAGLCRK